MNANEKRVVEDQFYSGEKNIPLLKFLYFHEYCNVITSY